MNQNLFLAPICVLLVWFTKDVKSDGICYSCYSMNLAPIWQVTGYPFRPTGGVSTASGDCYTVASTATPPALVTPTEPCTGTSVCVEYLFQISDPATGAPLSGSGGAVRGCLSTLLGFIPNPAILPHCEQGAFYPINPNTTTPLTGAANMMIKAVNFCTPTATTSCNGQYTAANYMTTPPYAAGGCTLTAYTNLNCNNCYGKSNCNSGTCVSPLWCGKDDIQVANGDHIVTKYCSPVNQFGMATCQKNTGQISVYTKAIESYSDTKCLCQGANCNGANDQNQLAISILIFSAITAICIVKK